MRRWERMNDRHSSKSKENQIEFKEEKQRRKRTVARSLAVKSCRSTAGLATPVRSTIRFPLVSRFSFLLPFEYCFAFIDFSEFIAFDKFFPHSFCHQLSLLTHSIGNLVNLAL